MKKWSERWVFLKISWKLPLLHSNQVPEYLVFWIHGQAGIGKTFLVGWYQATAREQGALTALTDEAEATAVRERSIVRAMGRIAGELAQAGGRLDAFARRYQGYQQCMRRIEADPNAPHGAFDRMRRALAAMSSISLTPGRPALGGALDAAGSTEDAAVEWVGNWAAYVARTFRRKADRAVVLEPIETLTPLFVEGVNAVADKRPVVVCFDSWERTGAHLDKWLRRLLQHEGLSASAWIVIAGRGPPAEEWEPLHPLMACFELNRFGEQETRAYLKQQGIAEEARVQAILEFSGGVPVLVSTLASAKGGSATEAADDLVDRYLKWVEDPRKREAALRCAAARRLNVEVVGAVMGEEDAGALFDWVSEMPFVQSRPGHWEYHPRVRELMLAYARRRSPTESRGVHGRLWAYHEGMLAAMEKESAYRDESWRRHRLEAVYHGLMQEDRGAMKEGLETFLLALSRCYPLAGEIGLTWAQVAAEQEGTNEAAKWAEPVVRVWAAIEGNRWESVLPACEKLRAREDLCEVARSEVLSISEVASARMQECRRAVANYERAIEVNPEVAAAC